MPWITCLLKYYHFFMQRIGSVMALTERHFTCRGNIDSMTPGVHILFFVTPRLHHGKSPTRPESLSYQKKDQRAWSCPSLFWYDTDF